MARNYLSNTMRPKGKLELRQTKTDVYTGFFTPPIEALRNINSNPADYKSAIFDINVTNRSITIFPFQVWSMYPMTNRYIKLSSIKIDWQWQPDDFVPNAENIEDFLMY